MEIGLYFGSFNPIHIGHLVIASHVANNTAVQQVWFVVSPQNPFKPSHTLLNEYHRLHLVTIAIENDTLLKVSKIEFNLPRPSYTIDTLTYLQEKFPQHSFHIIIGSDSFQNIHRWKNGNVLLDNYRFLVYIRPGFTKIENHPNAQILNAPLLDISSTQIRNLVKEEKSIRYLVPEKVRLEIENNGYYKR